MTRVSYAQMWLMPYHCLPGWPGSWTRSVWRGHEETAPGQRVHMGTVGSQEQRDHGKHALTSIQKSRKRVTFYMIEEDWIYLGLIKKKSLWKLPFTKVDGNSEKIKWQNSLMSHHQHQPKQWHSRHWRLKASALVLSSTLFFSFFTRKDFSV